MQNLQNKGEDLESNSPFEVFSPPFTAVDDDDPTTQHNVIQRRIVRDQANAVPAINGRSWITRLFLNPSSKFCCYLTLAVVIFLTIAVAFGGSYLFRIYGPSILNQDGTTKKSTLSVRKTIHMILLSSSVCVGGLACVGFFTSQSFRSFAFPGVAQLCFCHFVVSLLRLFQMMLYFAKNFKDQCLYVFFPYHFFQPASILWVGAICINLLLSVNASAVVDQVKTVQRRQQWSHVVIWLFSMISACFICYGYHKKVREFKESTGVCHGSHGWMYSYIALPLVVLVLVLAATFAFRRKLLVMYPKRTTDRINMRSNQYIMAYILSWAIIIPAFVVAEAEKGKSTTFYVARTIGYCIYDIQGFFYAFISFREYGYHSSRADVGLHLHNVNISDVEFGDPPKILGEGTYAVVFRGKWKTKSVAVKVFKLREVNREQMKMEAYLAAKLIHPNLILTYGCSVVDDNNIAIVTECMDEGTLDDIIFGEKLKYVQVLSYATMIAAGMDFLHTRTPAVVHRDLKPSNCLVKQKQIKIADFGCSRWVLGSRRLSMRSGTVDFSRTMTSNVGTPCWTAPELMAESTTTEYSLKVDVFSFAIILWQLYTGKQPYEEVNGSLLALEEAVIAGHRPEIPPDCPELLANTMRYGWDSNPVRRPSFAEIKQVLDVELESVRALREFCRR